MEEADKLFSAAFEPVCALKEANKLVPERFRIIFQAAKDYGPLLAHPEKWGRIEKQVEELSAAVAELQAARGVKKGLSELSLVFLLCLREVVFFAAFDV
jgi:hypothetical protein